MPPLLPDPPSLDDSAHVWLEAMVTRIEDDPDLLAALSDEEVDAALAKEGIRAPGVRAAVRRRVREAQAMPARSPARRTRFRLSMAFALAALGAIALASVWKVYTVNVEQDAAQSEVLAYAATLESLRVQVPQTKGGDAPPAESWVWRGAESLLNAARADPPSALLANDAVTYFIAAFETYDGLETSREKSEVAFFIGQSYRLAGRPDDAMVWFGLVKAESSYHTAAGKAMEAIQR